MKAQKSTKNFWPMLLYAGIALLLLLLICNISLIVYAVGLNKFVCAQAARAGAAACVSGGNQQDIEAAVFHTINSSDIHGFFIDRPELGELRFYIKGDKGLRQQMLLVKTVTGVRVPAPFLLFVTTPEQNGFIRFSSSCT